MNSTQKSTGEILFDIFYSMLREGGLVLNQNSIERLQDESRRSGISLQKVIEKEAKVVVKRLQEATAHGFKAAANDIAKLQETVKTLEACSHEPVKRKDIAKLQKDIDSLKEKVRAAYGLAQSK